MARRLGDERTGQFPEDSQKEFMSMIPTAGTPRRYRTTHDLTVAQRWLVRIMAENQYGRIENLRVAGGQPVRDQSLRVVRVARLGAVAAEAPAPDERDDFELKRAFGDLFEELSLLSDGLVNRLEFRHGLPFQIEMATSGESAAEPACPVLVRNDNRA